MEARHYTARGGETLKDVAQKVGADYATIVRLNKAFVHTKLRKGAQILIGFVSKEEDTDESQTDAKNKTSNEQNNAISARQAEKEAEAARKKAAQRQEALAAIDAAEKEYQQESAYVNADHTSKVNRLTELMRSNRNKLEGDLARQKIADSSIALNQRDKLQKQEEDEKLSVDMQTAHKLEQLNRKKDKTKETQNRKLASL